MRRCMKCGHVNTGDSDTCYMCGEKMPAQLVTKYNSPRSTGALKNWGVGSTILVVLMALKEWLLPIEYWTKPITRYNEAFRQAAVIYTFAAIAITLLYVWLLVTKRKSALYTVLVICGISVIVALVQSGFSAVFFGSLVTPALLFFILRDRVT